MVSLEARRLAQEAANAALVAYEERAAEARRDDGLDLIWGAEAIAGEIGRPLRTVYYLLEKGLLPAQKVGAVWITSRSALRRHFSQALGGVAVPGEVA
jgi:hypothetical protein